MDCLLRTLIGAVLVSGLSAQSSWFRHEGHTSNLGYGYAVARLGDLDGDGVSDYVVGAYKKGGFAEVRSGRTGALIHDLHESGCFGMGLVDLGDLTGDGVPEFAIGSPREVGDCHSCGIVRVYSGADAEVIATYEGEMTKQRFGYSLGAADVTGDGTLDLVVGSFWDGADAFEAGSADVFDVLADQHLYEVVGDRVPEEWFGTDVVGLGDLDGDGFGDFAVGAPRQWYLPSKNPPTGAVHVWSGRYGHRRFLLRGEHPGDHFGTSVARVGDLDGDGRDEFAVGSPRRRTGGVEVGCVEIFSGATGLLQRRWYGTELSKYGTSVDGIGDLDGDGIADVAIGACTCQNTFPMGEEPGYVELRSGATGEVLARIDGAPVESFGFSVAGLGDVTGDSVPDLLVGATWGDAAGVHTGRAEVVSGATLSLTMSPAVLSVSEPGEQELSIEAGVGLAGRAYVVLGSASGTQPGSAFPGAHVPLNFDAVTLLELEHLNTPTFADFAGTLDEVGSARATFRLPPGLPPATVGLTLHHAWIASDGLGGVGAAGNAAPLTLTW